jgi:hypothetical protein
LVEVVGFEELVDLRVGEGERAGYTIRTGSCRARLVTFGEGEATSSTPAKCSEPMIWLQKQAPCANFVAATPRWQNNHTQRIGHPGMWV